ncbi:MAG: DNA polymerase III subunit delta [Myxococcales bacterium]|jgi:DNA polymerase-3 subunit delta|nr:DNA polymerase III subunit delta [Myxococcales bacterium]
MKDAPSADVPSLLRSLEKGEPLPAYVIVGEEALLRTRAVRAIRERALEDGPEGFNEETFEGKGAKASTIIDAARTLPMMARRRFVLVRDADGLDAGELTQLATYLESPIDSACVVLVAEKLDGRSKLTKVAKAKGMLFEARPLKGAAVLRFVESEAKAKGKTLEGNVGGALVDALGEDLAALTDAVERLALYAGDRKAITLDDVAACITRARVETIWKLVDAISLRNSAEAAAALVSLLDDRSNALGLLSMIARQLRMVAKMRQALGEGRPTEEAAKIAGIPPFKAQAGRAAARAWTLPALEAAFLAIARAERSMKGSKVDAGDLLVELVLQLTQKQAA